MPVSDTFKQIFRGELGKSICWKMRLKWNGFGFHFKTNFVSFRKFIKGRKKEK